MSAPCSARSALAVAPWQRAVAAVVSGVAFVGAFPGWNAAWLAPISVASLLWALAGARARTAAWVSALQAAVGFGLLVHWVSAVAAVAWPALVVVMVLWRVALGVLLAALIRRPWAALTVPAAWVACEWLQSSVPWGGFPWGRLAFAGGLGWFTRAAAWVGADGLTFLVACAGVGLWQFTRRRRTGLVTGAGAVAALCVAAAAAPLVQPHQVAPALKVAVVQGGVPREGFATVEQERAVYANHLAATRAAVSENPGLDLIVWPESSLGYSAVSDAPTMAQLRSLIAAGGVPLLTGTVLTDSGDPAKLRNRAMLWNRDGEVAAIYDKQHLVPFGEFVPLRSLARRITPAVDLVGRDFAAGDRAGVMAFRPQVSFGVLICFEVGYGDLARRLGDVGFLVNQTNNATYMRSAQPQQQFRMAQVRAAESGRTTLVAATSGVSGAIDGYGQVVPGTEVVENRTHVSVVSVPVVSGLTPGLRAGAVAPWVCALLLGLAWLPRRIEAGRARRGPAAGADAAGGVS